MKLLKYIAIILPVIICIMILAACSSSGSGFYSAGDIIISEVVSSNSSSLLVDRYGSPDWLELYNNTDESIDLDDYSLSNTDTKEDVFVFSDTVIGPHEYLVVLAASEKVHGDCEYPVCGFNLPKSGCTLALSDADSVTVAKLSVPQLDRDISYCYTDGLYRFCITPTPGEPNEGIFYDSLDELRLAGTEGSVRINEACSTFIELYNDSDKTVQTALFCVSDDAGDLSKSRLPASELNPGEYFVLYFGGEGEPSTDFSVNEYESEIYLSLGGELYSSIDIYGLPDGASAGNLEDGRTVYYAVQTPGEKNPDVYVESLELTDMNDESPVMISEVLLENGTSLIDDNGDRSAWVEIYNRSDSAVDLSSYYLSDNTDNMYKWNLPGVSLEPGGYAVIYLSGNDGEWHTGFKVGSGEPVILTDASLNEKQVIEIPDESRLKDISYGEKDGEWLYFGKPTPGRANTTAGSESITNAEKLDKSQIYISEVSSASAARSGEKDWIEIYNPSDTVVQLDGIFLSDDENDLTKYELTGQAEPGAYIVVSASSKKSEQGEGVAPFSISASGDTIYLSDESGGIIDVFETGLPGTGNTSGRKAGDMSGDRYFFSTPTKGAENTGETGRKLNAPVFSVDGGIMDGTSVTVELSGEGDIYYTLDGSVPDTASQLYEQPITLSSNTSVSAVCCSDGCISSDAVSQTYIFGESHTLPVVCLSLSSSDLSSVSSSPDRKTKIERRCYVEYYDENGEEGTDFAAGLRIGGNGTRMYSQRTFQLYLRSGYGQSSVVYPFFEDYPITEFKSLVLRNGGQDNGKSRMRDTYAGMLFDFMNVDNAQGRFVVVYINGNYWGVYDLKENQNEDYFASRTGLESDEISVIRRNEMALSGSNAQIKEVYSKARSWSMSDDEVYGEFCNYVDADCFIDHIIARGYTADFDMFNQKYAYSDDYVMKVRPTFYDCDFAFSSAYGNVTAKYFTGDGVPSNDGTLSNMYIPTALKRNASWCEKFLERVSEIMKVLPQRSLDLFDEMYAELEPEMEQHIARWHTPGSFSAWKSNCSSLRSILEKRPKIYLSEIKSCFGVSDERMHELFPEYY